MLPELFLMTMGGVVAQSNFDTKRLKPTTHKKEAKGLR